MSRAPRSIPGILTTIAIAFVILTYALSFVITVAAIIATQLGSSLLDLNGFLPLEIFLILIPGVLPANGLGLILAFMLIFALCFWAAAKDRGGFIKSLAGLTRKSKPTTTPNWLVVMPLISSFLLVLTVILTISLNSAGVPVGNIPQNNPAELFASVTFAPVAEEIGFRITPIGLIVVIRTLLPLHRGRGLRNAGSSTVAKRILVALISPDRAKEAAGLTGLALGIVYLWYGAYADILLHWFFDFYNFTIFGALLGGPYSDILASLAVLTSLFLAVAGFVYGIRWLKPERPPKLQPPMTQITPPQF